VKRAHLRVSPRTRRLCSSSICSPLSMERQLSMSALEDWLRVGRRSRSSPEPPVRRLALASRGLLGVAACLWLLTVMLAPTTRGSGAALSGHKLADLVGSGALGGGVPRIMGPIWYLTPMCAAVVLATLGLDGGAARLVRFASALLAGAAAVGFVAFLTSLDWVRFGPGSWCAMAGAALVLVAAGIDSATFLRQRRTHGVL
jgi:hypothetical protein